MESSAISPMDSHQGRISTDYSREAELDRLLIAEPSKMKEEQKAFTEVIENDVIIEVAFSSISFIINPTQN